METPADAGSWKSRGDSLKHDTDTVVLVATNNQPPAAGHGTLAGGNRGSGVVIRYVHAANQDVLVTVSQQVSAGQQITRVGTYGNSTGCHLHFEVQLDGAFTNPAPVLSSHGITDLNSYRASLPGRLRP